MDTQLKKGLLEFIVLSVLKKRGDSYGYFLIDELSPYIEMTQATVYALLKRLEKESKLSAYSLAEKGRLRRYYKITERGIERLYQVREDLKVLRKVHEDFF